MRGLSLSARVAPTHSPPNGHDASPLQRVLICLVGLFIWAVVSATPRALAVPGEAEWPYPFNSKGLQDIFLFFFLFFPVFILFFF